MTAVIRGAGGGGGKKQRPPREAPDSLVSIAYARLIDLISEGEIYGLVDGANSIFLDETPASSGVGSLDWEVRHGTQDQPYLAGFPQVENEVSVGVELRSDMPWVQAFSNSDLSAVRVNFSVARFARQDAKSGDTNGYRVEYAIDVATNGGPLQEVQKSAFDGKTAGGYERSVRIDLPEGNSWQIRIRRLTPNSESSLIADTISIKSYTEIIDAKFRYPNSALVGLSFDAETFGGAVPRRGYHARGRIIRVPSNYDPETRLYTGIWDGTFKPAYTNNPAWVYYDLLLHPRYGLGDRIDASQMDKWGLYQIGQYCDQLVSDGKGGMEPRFTCNLYLQKRADAYKVLQDIAAIFRGITYWGAGQAIVSADMPSDPVFTYTNGNVKGGKFSYKGSKRSTRYSAALVSWNDPTDMYRAKVEYVQDDDAVARFGLQTVEISAIGCTSQGQAQRAGKWALLTNLLETETVNFPVGLDGIRARPGQVIRVADNDRAGRRIGGRVHSATDSVVIVDKVEGVQIGDELTCILPSGVAQTRDVTGVDGHEISISPAFDAAPAGQSVWAWESDEVAAQRYRIINIGESGPLEYAITASKYVEGKHASVDTGAIISQRPITSIPSSVQAAPENIRAISNWMLEQTMAVTTMTIIWDVAEGATRYDVEWRKDDGAWVYAGRTGSTEMDVTGIYAGTYQIRVRALNSLDVPSPWGYSSSIELAGKTGTPPAVAYLNAASEIFGIRLDWGFPEGAEDTQRTEIEYNTGPQAENALHLGDYAYPSDTHTMTGLSAAKVFYFRARLVDRTGNVGPWSDWVFGQSSAEASEILDYIAGQIDESHLGQHLQGEIDKISGDGPGSVNDRVGELNDELQSSVSGLNQAIAGAESRLDEGIADLATDVSGLHGQVGTLGDELQSSVSGLSQAITEAESRLDGEIGNLAGDISTIGSSISDLSGRVGDLDSDLQSSVAGLNADLANLEMQLADITGAEEWSPDAPYLAGTLVLEDGTLYRADQDVPAGTPVSNTVYWRKVGDYSSIGEAVAALAIQVTDMQVHVDEIAGTQSSIIETTDALIASTRGRRADGDKADSLRGWETQASIAQRERVEATDKEALAERLLLIDAQVADAHGQLSTLEQAFASESEATASQLNTLASELGTTTAGLQQEVSTRATQFSALSQDILAMQAELEGVATSDALQALTVQVEELGDGISAVSQSVTDLISRISDTETGLQGVSEAVSGLQASVSDIDGVLLAQADEITNLDASLKTVSDVADGAADLAGQADGKADDALQGLQSKADSSAMQGLQVEVRQLGDEVAANSGSITQLSSSVTTAQEAADEALQGLGSKADSSALQALETGVQQIGEDVTSNTNSITEMGSSITTAQQAADDALAGLEDKADSSIVQAMSTEVQKIGNDVSTNTDSISQMEGRLESAETGISGNAGAISQMGTEVSEIDGRVTANADMSNRLSASLRPSRADGEKADSLRGWQSQSAITESQRVEASDKEALARRLLDIDAEVSGAHAQLSMLEQTFAGESEATASRLTQLASELGTTSVSLQREIQTRATQTSALAQDVQAMQAALEGVATSGALAALRTEVEQLGDNVTGLSQSIVALSGRLDDTDTGLQAVSDAVSSIGSSVSDIDDRVTAQAGEITDISSSLRTVSDTADGAADLAGQADGKADEALAGLTSKADASVVQSVQAEVSQLGDDVSANTGSITQMGSSISDAQQTADDALAGLGGKADASIVQAMGTEVEKIGDDVSANTQSITHMSGRLESAETGIAGNADAVESLATEVAEVDGKVEAASEQASRLTAALRPTRADGEKADSLRGWQSQAEISESTRVNATERAVLAERLFDAEVQMGVANAQLSILERAFADESESTASQLTRLASEMDSTSVALSNEVSTRATETAALAQDVSALQAALGDVASADALAALITEVEELEGRVTATVQDIVALSASLSQAIDDIATKADSSAVQALSATVEQQGDQITAVSESVTTLESTVNDEISAAVQTLQQAVSDESSARATAIQGVQAEVQTVQSAADQAAQDAGEALQEAGDASAAVQQTSQAVADLEDGLSAMWSVKMQVNANGQYVYAGIGLGIENGPGGLQSQFLVEANRFALLNTLNGVTTTPFVVEGGQVFMDSAVIKQADIVNLIVTGVLQSGNYVAGQQGLRINFVTGEFEMNATVPGQGRTVMTNRAIKVFDGQNPPRLRVQMGDLSA